MDNSAYSPDYGMDLQGSAGGKTKVAEKYTEARRVRMEQLETASSPGTGTRFRTCTIHSVSVFEKSVK